MSFPHYPNPARRARILEAQQLRMQGLTMRQIAECMNCSVSTVHAYLRDFELFRADLIQELAADQLVAHLIHLGDPDDPRHDQRRADLHELRLLLTALPQIRRDESDRSVELLQAGVAVDRYGTRYPQPDRLHAPTPEETEQIQQPTPAPEAPDPDQPLVFIPEPSRTEPNTAEQDSTPNPARDGASADPNPKSRPPELQQALDQVERQLQDVLRPRNWLKDYPKHNPNHPQRQRALRLVERKEALLAQARSESENPDAA